jgi:putative GTP pyrophosphokinase
MFIEEELRREYDLKYGLYEKLGLLLEARINLVLREKEITYDYVQMRIKRFVSFFEKIDRHEKWKKPFEENEDFCGLRIIHLFDDDLILIKNILKEEFDVFREHSPTEKRPLTEKEFTYRSYHAFVKLKGKLAQENAELTGLFAEVQVRTICMHTWAAIEHKLNYKQQKSLPPHFRPIMNRKFSQMSAVLEIADEFFVSLRNEKKKSVEGFKSGLNRIETKEQILNDELNFDALQAYLENKFPNFATEKKIDKNKKLEHFFKEMIISNLTLKSIEEGLKVLAEKKLLGTIFKEYPAEKPTQTGIARLILDITNSNFYEERKKKLEKTKWMKFVDKIRSLMS